MTTTSRSSRFSYESCLRASEKIAWTVEDLIRPGCALDFDRPFLPESLARVDELEFLDPAARLSANQIRGHGYLCTFGLVEKFILPFVLDHARLDLGADDVRTRALLHFAAEEAKHIHLFEAFRAAFERDFGVACEVIGPPQAIADHVLAQDRLGVALLVLHIEWMTQRHFVDSVCENDILDPLFTSLLRHHWMEEAQHARLDTLMVEEMADGMDALAIDRGLETYLALCVFLDEGMAAQAAMDLDALQRVELFELAPGEQEVYLRSQHQAWRWTCIGSGMSHPELLTTVERIAPDWRSRIEEAARTFS